MALFVAHMATREHFTTHVGAPPMLGALAERFAPFLLLLLLLLLRASSLRTKHVVSPLCQRHPRRRRRRFSATSRKLLLEIQRATRLHGYDRGTDTRRSTDCLAAVAARKKLSAFRCAYGRVVWRSLGQAAVYRYRVLAARHGDLHWMAAANRLWVHGLVAPRVV